ncbi:MAG: pectate lyase [Prevotella sp.]|nr:pectate lyase [Prevotella sp.]MDD4533304.1 pectate lyase [Prevotella sp.]
MGLTFLSLFVAGAMQAQTIAFPGAEGFGRFTTGGRGGKVLHVTTLDDGTSTGTFRWACNQSGARTIVFDVSGTIHLTSALKLGRGDVTIAGQTAPGDGICVADFPFQISANNVIIRFMRFRLGNKMVAFHEGDGLGGMDKENIILDHCSVSWSIDECLAMYGSKNITIQWCLASQSLRNAGHSKGPHGYGAIWGGSGASYHHNLLVHHDSRAPRLGPRPGTQTDERMDMRNNVIYNWAGNGCYGGEGMNVNIVNNYYKPGPATLQRSSYIQKRIAAIGIRTSSYTLHDTATPNEWDKMWHVWGKYYVDGNVNTKNADVTKDNWTYGIYNQIDNSTVDNTFTATTRDTMRILAPINFAPVTTHTAEVAYERVLDYAGASLHRDWVDTLMVYDTRLGIASYTGKDSGDLPGIIDSQDDNRPANAPADWNPWPVLVSTTPPVDTDKDGMPDSWEDANGLNPSDAADGAKITASGYTNLEIYMNSLVDPIVQGGNVGGTIMQSENTTGITLAPSKNHSANLAMAEHSSDIFDLNGKVIRQDACAADLSSLPHGVYIFQNQTYTVK